MTERFRTLAEEPVPDNGVPRMELADWRRRFGLVAGITSARGGFDLGLFGDAPAGQVMARWLQFRDCLLAAFPGLALARQVHGCRIATHRAGSAWTLLDGTDGHVTADAGLLLTVTVADCIPIYLLHPASGVLGLLHAGWRGIAAGVVEAGIDAMAASMSASVKEVVMHCGVGICGGCYEVGHEVATALDARPATGKTKVDLRQAAGKRAQARGVRDISVSSWCSAHDPEFFSHRASAGAPGRMAAYLGRPLA